MGYDLDRYEDERELHFFEDDGALHFCLGNGNRYCVYLGQDMSRSEYIDYCNERAVAIAKEYGMKPKKMSVKAWLR